MKLDSIPPHLLAGVLSERLRDQASLPRARLSPELSYGRHRGPVRAHARMAAVAIALYHDPTRGWMLPLTLRPANLQHHPSQVCLPGGKIESRENATQAALREFNEELGIKPVIRFDCGLLSAQYVYASHNLVQPVVMIIDAPDQVWSPDPSEVQEVIPIPLRTLQDPTHRTSTILRRPVRIESAEVDCLVFRASAIEFERYQIWGATALILDQLAQILPA